MKFDLVTPGEGIITIAADPVFTDIRLSMSTKNILRIVPSTSKNGKGNPEIKLELLNTQEIYRIELMVPKESGFKKRLSNSSPKMQ